MISPAQPRSGRIRSDTTSTSSFLRCTVGPSQLRSVLKQSDSPRGSQSPSLVSPPSVAGATDAFAISCGAERASENSWDDRASITSCGSSYDTHDTPCTPFFTEFAIHRPSITSLFKDDPIETGEPRAVTEETAMTSAGASSMPFAAATSLRIRRSTPSTQRTRPPSLRISGWNYPAGEAPQQIVSDDSGYTLLPLDPRSPRSGAAAPSPTSPESPLGLSVDKWHIKAGLKPVKPCPAPAALRTSYRYSGLAEPK